MCYYRDKQTTNKFQIAKVTKEGSSVSEPFAIQTKWDYKVCCFGGTDRHGWATDHLWRAWLIV